jgi:hypothetical protein
MAITPHAPMRGRKHYQFLITIALATPLAVMLETSSPASGQVIYQDDFSGSGSLNGAAPDVRPGAETWDATDWRADGTITAPATNLGSNAFLPFTPVAGKVYSLSLEVNPTTSTDPTTWFGLGFASVSSPPGNYFGFYNAGPWMILRVQRDGFDTIPNNADDAGDLETFPGPVTTGFQDHDAAHGVAAFEIVLDTTGAQWQTQWLVNNSLIRSDTYAVNPTINYVGFGRYQDTQGYVDNFSLTVIPEPTSLGLSAVALALLAATRRQR